MAAQVFSGIQPTGVPHLGNYFGAIRQWVRLQKAAAVHQKPVYCVVDLHALTRALDPCRQASSMATPMPSPSLRHSSREMARWLLASGLDPNLCILFRQSQISQHGQLAWITGCLTKHAHLSRMTQWKERREAGSAMDFGHFSYPVLQAADILLFRASLVPVGQDQQQHIELTRRIAQKLNDICGTPLFPVPEPIFDSVPRLRSLTDPAKKMSKSDGQRRSRIDLSASSEEIANHIRKACTDSIHGISYDTVTRPGLANLIDIYSLTTGVSPEIVAEQESHLSHSAFKELLLEVLLSLLGPIQKEADRLKQDPMYVESILCSGALRASKIAQKTLNDVYESLSLGPILVG